MLFTIGLRTVARRSPYLMYRAIPATSAYRTLFTSATLQDPTRSTKETAPSPKKKAPSSTKDKKPASKKSASATKKSDAKPKSPKKKVEEAKKKPVEETLLYTPPPKRPLTPWMDFYISDGSFGRGVDPKAVAKSAAAKWSALSDAEKEVHVLKYQAGRQQYLLDLAAWRHEQSPEALKQLARHRLQRYRKRAAARAAKDPTSHIKAPLTSYMVFSTEFFKDFDQTTIPKETKKFAARYIATRASEKWHQMSEYEKAPYEQKYREGMQKYHAAKKAALESLSS